MKAKNSDKILIVDDNHELATTLKDILEDDYYCVDIAGNLSVARQKIKRKFYNIILLDLKLPDGEGINLLPSIKECNQDTAVIILTAFASLSTAISAMKSGAYSYLSKPLNIEELKITIKKALDNQKTIIKNRELLYKLKELNLKDPFTGFYNYRYLKERLKAEFQRAKRHLLSLSVLKIDIDYFESINELYGDTYGDSILKEFARLIKRYCRQIDIIARTGGEEFVIILPETDKEGAVIIAQRFLSKIKSHIFDKKGKRIKLNASIGVGSFPEDGVKSASQILDIVSRSIREAKQRGGGNIATYKGVSNKKIKEIIKKGEEESIDKLRSRIIRIEDTMQKAFLESIYAFAKAVEAKDQYTSHHAENMISLVVGVGKELNLSEEEIELLRRAAILHDLGKIGISDKILHKKNKLTPGEYAKIKRHPQIGAEILRSIHFLKDVVPFILYHHERYDGLGYPEGLKGEEIPLGARIVAVADVYHALISDRPYRKSLSHQEALKIIIEGSGTHFDPKVVKAFENFINKKHILR